MSIGCVAIAGGPQDVVSSSGALWEHQTAETARGRKWCIRYRVTGLRNSVLAISNADWGILSVAVRSSFRSVSTSGTVEIEARLPQILALGKTVTCSLRNGGKPMMYTALRTRTAGRWLMFCYCVFAMLFTLVPPSLAQSTYGTLRGTIRDQSQAVVPGATVTALNVDGNFSRTTISDESGNYEFQNLPPGRYEASAEITGFKKLVNSDVPVGPREVVRVDFSLQVASGSDQVVVTGEASVVNSETPTISGSKTNVELKDLPLNFRGGNSSPINMVSLVPGVQVDQGNRITLAGNKIAQNEFTIDGISSTSVRSNGPLRELFPSVEGISEIKVTSTN